MKYLIKTLFLLFAIICVSKAANDIESSDWVLWNDYFTASSIPSSDLGGWTFSGTASSSKITNCGGTSLVGGYNVSGQNAELKRKITGMPVHWRMKVLVDVMLIDSWDNETFYIYLDND